MLKAMLCAVASIKYPLVFAIAMLAAAFPSNAQVRSTYPEGNIRLLYGFPPGADTTARLLADRLAEALGKPVIVDNVTGAGGNLAADRTAKAKPDGLTIGLLTGANIVISPSLYKLLPYDPIKDLVPISLVYENPNVLLVGSEVSAKTVNDLVALARTRPGQLTYGHNGIGTTTHLSAELFKAVAGVSVQEIPYRGLPPMLPDLLSGRITMTFNSPQATMPLVREGKLRALAVTSPTRAPFAPEVPTLVESGFPEFNISVWYGLFAPAGTPARIVDVLNHETMKIAATLEFQSKNLSLGEVSRGTSADELVQRIAAERPFWARLIKQAGVNPIE